jgi:3-phosphoshikimate 1-carboxyvinyltransferase
MIVTIHPSAISGTITAPASKSSMQRACAAALLHQGKTVIVNPGNSNDDKAALQVIQHLGASVEKLADGNISITGSNFYQIADGQQRVINCGESGLGIRMFAPIAALAASLTTINGEGSLLSRPMHFFDEIFPQLGIRIQSQSGYLPIQLQGPLQPANITIDGSLSSQFLTGLLFAFARVVTNSTTITVRELKSTPYIDLTLKVMAHFGYQVVNNNYESFTISPPVAVSAQKEYTVEGDWSGASFLLVAGALAGGIVVKGLDVFSTQADKAILQALQSSGAMLSIQENEIKVSPAPLQAFHFDATHCPDLFPPLVALAACCKGTTAIAGAERLTHKESNRALTLQEEFGKMGIKIVLQDDLMLVHGGTGLQGATVHSHHDHRIAMACAVAGLVANGNTVIHAADAIAKSYPDFYSHLQKLHAHVG